MSDEPIRPRWPPRQLSDDEVVEIPAGRPPRRPPPAEPFRRLAVTSDVVAQKLDEVLASHREILATQRKLALQLDGYGVTVNQRFDVFHEELAMLRATVLGDHAPRLETVEESVGVKAAKRGGLVALALVGLPMLAEALPKYRHLFETILGVLQ